MNDTILNVSDSSFEGEVLAADVPVLVDFWAEWCGPCRAIAPVLDEVAQQYGDALKVVKIDIEENETTASKLAIRSIPTFHLYKAGEVVAQKTGAVTKAELVDLLETHL